MKRTIKFLDTERKMAKVTVSTESGYLSLTAECNGHHGQSYDQIKTDTDAQAELIKLWEEKHLKPVPTDQDELETFLDDINNLLDRIEEEEQERMGEVSCSELEDEDIVLHLIQMDNNGDAPSWFEISTNEELELKDRISDDTFTGIALAKHCDISPNDLSDIENDRDNHWSVQREEFLAGDDADMDDEWDDSLDNYLDECVLPELPENAQRYFDRDSWKSDAKMDGRGHSLNRYDGGEDEETVFGKTIYIYKQ